jgi:hypothetical protein
MKPLIMQFSPSSYYFLPLRSKNSPQHPVLRHPQQAINQEQIYIYLGDDFETHSVWIWTQKGTKKRRKLFLLLR